MISTDEGVKIKETFISKAKHLSLILHLDTKKFTNVLNQGNYVERVVVNLSSADLNYPQLIGIIGISDVCGIPRLL